MKTPKTLSSGINSCIVLRDYQLRADVLALKDPLDDDGKFVNELAMSILKTIYRPPHAEQFELIIDRNSSQSSLGIRGLTPTETVANFKIRETDQYLGFIKVVIHPHWYGYRKYDVTIGLCATSTEFQKEHLMPCLYENFTDTDQIQNTNIWKTENTYITVPMHIPDPKKTQSQIHVHHQTLINQM